MTTMDSILENFQKHVFYHGTSLVAAESIVQQGFQVWIQIEGWGRGPRGGNLGVGVYVSCNWRTALWFGPALLRVSMRPGTRLLNAAVRPDKSCLAYLEREFGREILNKPPLRVLPKNKKLTLEELVNLFRYHYWQTWEKNYSRDREGSVKWPRRRQIHSQLVSDFRKLLIRYGFDGFGNPEDDNGVVIFAEDRIKVNELVADVPFDMYSEAQTSNFEQFQNLDEIRDLFRRRGSRKAKVLAERVAAAESNEPCR